MTFYRSRVAIAFAAGALILAACQGGLDSGSGGMPGDVGPPVQNPGPMNASPGTEGGEMQGPQMGPNGQPELTMPGSTLAPNEAQYPVGEGPTGMKCPQVSLQLQQFNCTVSFNMPLPSPSPSGSPNPKSKATPKPTPSPTPSPSPSASSDDSDDDSGATPSPTPPGTITLQMEPVPKDVPPMVRPDPRAIHVTPLVAVRLQSDSDFKLNGLAAMQYVLPRQQLPSRGFAIQLYNEGMLRGKRIDQYLASYDKYNLSDNNLQFVFPTPSLTVKRGQIWLIALYGLTYAPGATATPSPTPAASSSPGSATSQLFTPPTASPSASP